MLLAIYLWPLIRGLHIVARKKAISKLVKGQNVKIIRLICFLAVLNVKTAPDHDLTYFTNQRIVIPRDIILCCSDDASPYNNILRADLIDLKDYRLVSKE